MKNKNKIILSKKDSEILSSSLINPPLPSKGLRDAGTDYNSFIMKEKDKVRLGRFLCLILRHKPSEIGLSLDKEGFVKISDLLYGLKKAGWGVVTKEILLNIVEEDSKQRYSLSEDSLKIRASQGHSIDVDSGLVSKEPPEILFHGTAKNNFDSILSSGIKKMKRTYVHLSPNEETAINVAKRHGSDIVIFTIDTKTMWEDGIDFKISLNGVWLTDFIDKKYIKKWIFLSETE